MLFDFIIKLVAWGDFGSIEKSVHVGIINEPFYLLSMDSPRATSFGMAKEYRY